MPSCGPLQHQIIPIPFILQQQIFLKFAFSRLYHGHCLLLLSCSKPLCHQRLLHLTQFSSLLLFPPGNFTVLFFFFFNNPNPKTSQFLDFPVSNLWNLDFMEYSDRHSHLSLHLYTISIAIDNSSPVQITSLKSLSCKFPLVLLLHRTFQALYQPDSAFSVLA